LLAIPGLPLPASTSGPLLCCSRDCKRFFHQTWRRNTRDCMSRHLKLVSLCIKLKCWTLTRDEGRLQSQRQPLNLPSWARYCMLNYPSMLTSSN
jgi:hypothetical protein